MKTLITGGSGLLGSELTVSNSLKPTSDELNLLNYDALKKYIELNNVTKIIHCAAMVGGVHVNQSRMFDFFDANIQININVLRACREFNLNNSVFILSTCIMPSNATLPYSETQLHLGEPHFTNYGYAYAKRMLEVGSRSLRQQYHVNTTCLIPCNLYGKNDNYNVSDGHVIPGLIHKCYLSKKNNEDFIVWGSGNPRREFLYVKDLAQIIKIIVENENEYETMIISPGVEFQIKEVVSLIASKLNFGGNVIYDTTKPDGIDEKTTSNYVFRSYFPTFAFTELKYGLEETIQYFIEMYPKLRL